jgi:hypothetical protein
VYELFASLGGTVVREADRRLFNDVLMFDYCMNEMPLLGKLPSFVARRQHDCSWPGRNQLPDGVDLPADSRVRTFRFQFLRDYRVEPWVDDPTAVTFAYASGKGKGLRVFVI